jgi:hypothetical protein
MFKSLDDDLETSGVHMLLLTEAGRRSTVDIAEPQNNHAEGTENFAAAISTIITARRNTVLTTALNGGKARRLID